MSLLAIPAMHCQSKKMVRIMKIILIDAETTISETYKMNLEANSNASDAPHSKEGNLNSIIPTSDYNGY